MISLTRIIEGLAETLASIDGLRVHDHVPGNTEFPAAIITPPEIDYRQTMDRGVIRLELEVVVLVGAVVDRNQKTLFHYLDWEGSSSIVAVIDADPTLGGIEGINAVPMSARPLALEEVASYQAWGAAQQFLIHRTS